MSGYQYYQPNSTPAAELRQRPNAKGIGECYNEVVEEWEKFQMEDAKKGNDYNDDDDDDDFQDEHTKVGDYQKYAEEKLMKRLIAKEKEMEKQNRGSQGWLDREITIVQFWTILFIAALVICIVGSLTVYLFTRK